MSVNLLPNIQRQERRDKRNRHWNHQVKNLKRNAGSYIDRNAHAVSGAESVGDNMSVGIANETAKDITAMIHGQNVDLMNETDKTYCYGNSNQGYGNSDPKQHVLSRYQ